MDLPVQIVAAGLTFGGAALLAFFVHRWNGRREARGRKAAASLKLREAFAPELSAAEADTGNKINYMEFLRTAHDERHAQAVLAFEPFVTARQLGAFCDGWNRYRYGENDDGTTQQPDSEDMDHDDLYFLEYSTEWDLRRPERPRENTITRIRNLLRYASET